MAIITNIQWCDLTWNIGRGCDKVDEDCKFCYMYRDSLNSTRYDPYKVIRTKTVFDLPLKYKETDSKCRPGKPLVFTCSLTDFFHESVDSFRNEAWDIVRKCPHLIFQILTKRPERIANNLPFDWGEGWDNVWLGTSCGSPKGMQRIYDLVSVKSRTKFLSLEPLWGNVVLNNLASYFDWIIVGGESGNEVGKYRYRPCEINWIHKIVEDSKNFNTPVFVKQLGTYLSKTMGLSDRHGGNFAEFPENLKFREFPL